MAIERPPRNSWEMQNLITFASSHLIDNPDHRHRAQAVAASYASEETHTRICPLCRRTN